MLIGATVPAVGGMHTVFERAQDWQCDCVQLFITRSRTWDTPPLAETEVAAFEGAWSRSRVQSVVSHVPYLVNLGSEHGALRERSIQRLRLELEHAQRLKVQFVVLHPGSSGRGGQRSTACDWIVEGAKSVLGSLHGDAPTLLFESMAGQGGTVGSTFEELAHLIHELKGTAQVGACLDTAHVFAAGYDISGYAGYQDVMERFDSMVGIEWLKVIHVNDSKVAYGTRVDRHAPPGDGHIGLETFHALARDKRFSHVPLILELPDPSTTPNAILQLRNLVEREAPVEPRIAEARQLRLY